MQRRTFLAGTSLLTGATALSPSACQDPTLILAAIEPESQARLLIRAATLAQRAGRLNEALHLAHSAHELARGLPYREVSCAYLAISLGRLRAPAPRRSSPGDSPRGSARSPRDLASRRRYQASPARACPALNAARSHRSATSDLRRLVSAP